MAGSALPQNLRLRPAFVPQSRDYGVAGVRLYTRICCFIGGSAAPQPARRGGGDAKYFSAPPTFVTSSKSPSPSLRRTKGTGRSTICGRHSESFREQADRSTVWGLEAPLVFHQFPSCSVRRRARSAHRLDLETKTVAARRALFFPSSRAGGAVVPSGR